MNILIADDEAGSLLVAQATVTALGHDCRVASDGETAWRLFQRTRPDVVMTDWLMPGIDGVELCRRIRADPRTGYTYLILLTSLAQHEDVRTGMEAGADDYLTKPLHPFALETRLVAAQRVTALHAELARYRDELTTAALTDPLTGLRNRRSLDEDISVLHAASVRHSRGYCVAVCDIDHFKAYNDTYGHQAGDRVLQRVAAALSAHARRGDRVYRFGGEEFLITLPEQCEEGAAAAVERMLASVEGLGIAHSGTSGGLLTLSAGVAAFQPGRLETSEQLVERADQALYAAKAAGRNAVMPAGSGAEN